MKSLGEVEKLKNNRDEADIDPLKASKRSQS
jgi:hypothetical protein